MANDIDLVVTSDQPPLQIAMIAYDDLTLLDLVGPQAVFSTVGVSHIVSHSMTPVMGDSNMAIVPTCTYETCPKELDVLMVPGGRGTIAAMKDEVLLDFLRDRARTARYVTSVCSGSLVLAAAGVLRGYKSTSHWAVHDVLGEFEDVEPVEARVVIDRNRMSGGGVTAGIDFGLSLLRELRGEQVARLSQLLMEYDPQPPIDAGSPARAGAELTGIARGLMSGYRSAAAEAARASVGAKVRA